LKKKYFVINTEKPEPDLWLASEDPVVRTFDLGEPFLSISALF
jgi:hypothetical protein